MVNRTQIGTGLLAVGLIVAAIGVLGVAEAGPFAPQECAPWTLQVSEMSDRPTDEDPVAFENMSDYRQETFRDALDANDNEVAINQSRWFEPSESPQVVAYEDSYYRIFAKQNECNVFQEIYVMGGVLASILGVGLGAVGLLLRRNATTEN